MGVNRINIGIGVPGAPRRPLEICQKTRITREEIVIETIDRSSNSCKRSRVVQNLLTSSSRKRGEDS